MYCPNCGKAVEESAHFCANCGKPLLKNMPDYSKEFDSSVQNGKTTTKEPKVKNSNLIALIFTVLVLLALGSCLASGDKGDDGEGGKCKYCGTHTNWTYKGGGYVCYSCDHE